MRAEATNVTLFALGRAIDDADLTDQALVQVAVGLLGMGARLL